MAYIKGIIPKSKVRYFSEHLRTGGYSVRPASSKWELYHVLLNGRWTAITVDAKDVVGLPEDLVTVAQDFLRGTFTPGITDTQRLDFLLSKYRIVVVEQAGYNGRGEIHYEVYVEEGFMADHQYPAVRVTGREANVVTAEVKRQAIDLAINNPISVSEKA